MSAERSAHADLAAFLRTNGWIADSPGAAGVLWRREGALHPVAVPEGVSPERLEWAEVIVRIAEAQGVAPPVIERGVRLFYVDVHNFRSSNDGQIPESILVEAGFSLFSAARTLIRSAASTSRSLKSQIGSNYGRVALELAAKARFGHTKQGSYVVPLLMPLGRPEGEGSESRFTFDEPNVEHPLVEPQERLVTRTLAQALTAIRKGVIEPATEPRRSIVTPLVAAGVSREMMMALAGAVESEGVASLDIAFSWAPAFEEPPGGLRAVEIPSESSPLLRLAAEHLRSEKKHQGELLSGRIIDLGDDDETGYRRATLRTYRRGRQTRLNVFLNADTIIQAHRWFEERRDISVSGVVKTSPGASPWIDEPDYFAPLDEMVLFHDNPDSSQQ